MSINLTDVASGYNLQAINSNFTAIAQALNNSIVWKNGTVAGETLMNRDLDMNGNRILNADISVSSLTNDRAIRVPITDGYIPPLPPAGDRKGKILSFNQFTGLPEVLAPASGSALDVLNQLQSSAGATLIGYKAPFTNSVLRTQSQVNMDQYSVKDWGAKGDGVTDDTQSIKNALNELQGKDAVLYFPEGSYVVSSRIDYNLGQKTHIVLKGSGINTTEIKATGATQNLFRITGPTANIWLNSVLPNGSFDIKDLTLGCYGNSVLTGVALDIQLGSVVGGPCKTINIENVNFRAEIGGWATHLSLFNSAQISLTNCKFYSANNSRSAIAISVSCEDGKDGTNLTMVQCEFFFFQYGVYHGNHFEGIVAVNCSFINCDYGITSICVAESGALISNCEFDCYVEGIHLEGLYDFVISGCSFFAMGPNTKGIVIVGGNGFTISGCKIFGTGPADGIGIYLQNTNGSLGRTGFIGANGISGYAVAMQVVGCNNLTFGEFGWNNCGIDTLISGTNTNIRDYGYTSSALFSKSLGAPTTSWSVSFDITSMGLSRKPLYANLVATTGDGLICRYNYSASTATNAVFVVTLANGGSIGAATYGFTLFINSPFFQV